MNIVFLVKNNNTMTSNKYLLREEYFF